jgi:short-subunit dehydrogenase
VIEKTQGTDKSMVRPVALVTGASEGFGRELIDLIAADGYDLLIVARNRQRLEAAAQSITATCAVAVEVYPCDLSEPNQQLALAARLQELPNLKLVVNNAATSLAGTLPSVPALKLQQIVGLNFAALCVLSRAALCNRDFCHGGTLLNIGSIGGSYPMPLDAAYSSTKAAIDHFSRSIAYEIARDSVVDVHVQVAKLGGLKTGWNDRSMGKLRPGEIPDPRAENLQNEPDAAARAIWAHCKAHKKMFFHDTRLAAVIDFLFGRFQKLGAWWVYRFYSDETARRS